MTQIDNHFGRGREAPNSVKILRGDERLARSYSRLSGDWFCQVHGMQKPVLVLAAGEKYLACKECLWTAPAIELAEAEDSEEEKQ